MGGKRRWKQKKFSSDFDHHNVKQHREDHTLRGSESFPISVMESLEWCFKKSYSYNCQDEKQWSFNVDNLFPAEEWQDAELMKLKEKLNAVKSELSDLDIRTWHAHTTAMNKGGFIINTVRRTINPELCTQAWCKFYEIISTFHLLENMNKDNTESQCLRSLHLCEAPGAFIASLNHYLKSKEIPLKWQWLANTLNPHYEGNRQSQMIADDRFIIQTQDNWHFGPENTGDIMSKDNVTGISSQFQDSESKFHLVTADGSIDCADNPAEQEKETSQLHYCEVVTALSILKQGGSMVLKMFTLMEESSISIMYILNCTFQKVTVFKPVSSKPGNSEVYVVSEYYRGLSRNAIDKLIEKVGQTKLSSAVLCESVIPESFRSQHRECCQTFTDYQKDTIESNRISFGVFRSASEAEYQDTAKQCCASMYIEKCSLEPISFSERLGRPKKDDGRFMNLSHMYLCRKRHEGSFLQRQQDKQLSWQQRLGEMELYEDQPLSNPVVLMESRPGLKLVEDFKEWKIIQGKRLNGVYSSRFCNEQLLSLYNEFLQHTDEEVTQVSAMPGCKSSNKLPPQFREYFPQERKLAVSGDEGPLLNYMAEILGSTVVSKDAVRAEKSNPVLHIIETTSAIKEKEVLCNQQSFTKCLNLIQEIKSGDFLLFQSAFPLTRINAGLLYVLHAMFTSVKLFIPEGMTEPCVYVLCMEYISSQHDDSQNSKVVQESHPTRSNACAISHNSSSLGSNTSVECDDAIKVFTLKHESKQIKPSASSSTQISGLDVGVSDLEDNKSSEEKVQSGCEQINSDTGPCVQSSVYNKIQSTSLTANEYNIGVDSYDEKQASFSSLKRYLGDVCKMCCVLEGDHEGNKQVLEFMPMRYLYEGEFYQNLCVTNDAILQKRINHFIATHRNKDKVT